VGKRFFIPIEKGGTKGYTPPLDKFLPKYYQMRGWNEEGIPK
jgi:aldehyde:ferredoxin oxidoreductase